MVAAAALLRRAPQRVGGRRDGEQAGEESIAVCLCSGWIVVWEVGLQQFGLDRFRTSEIQRVRLYCHLAARVLIKGTI